ncbi:MAG: nicotinate (nicotinamide) nucleotide adenylyltransferase [Planctomycetes bacterium]|nr:nicotinate (nicotinamide) nucleotide adenylyltransferase [Planctomycetota bacterium]
MGASAAHERCVILGGSFDPVHGAHLALAEAAQARGAVAELLWLPAARSPFKDAAPRIADADRVDLLRAVVEARPGERIELCELQRPAPSYMVDTLQLLKANGEERPLALLMGQDTLAGLPRWKQADELTRLAEFWVAPRPGAAPLDEQLVEVRQALPGLRVTTLDFVPTGLSSTALRACLARGEDPGAEALPRPVWELIQARRLYRAG